MALLGSCIVRLHLLLKWSKGIKKVNKKWVEGTPKPDLLEDYLALTRPTALKCVFYALKLHHDVHIFQLLSKSFRCCIL